MVKYGFLVVLPVKGLILIISKKNFKKSQWHSRRYGELIYRQDPSRRSIEINSEWNEELDEARYFLSFPYVFFGISYQVRQTKIENKRPYSYRAVALKVCFGADPDLKKNYHASLPNIQGDGGVCINLPAKYFSSLDELAKSVVQNFWQSAFDPSEIESYYASYHPKKIMASLPKWQAETKKDPNWIPSNRQMVLNHNPEDIFILNDK